MKEKLEHSVTKLIRIPINEFQAYIYFNMYMVRSIYFRVGIVKLSIKKYNKLKKIHKTPLVRKCNGSFSGYHSKASNRIKVRYTTTWKTPRTPTRSLIPVN